MRDAQYETRKRREEMRAVSRKEAEAIFALAGFTVSHVWELANGYWPDSPDYDNVRRPWWLLMTELGPIRIGWRKRVLSINWEATSVRVEVTQEDVTKDYQMVHAWTVEKAVEYLKALRTAAQSSGRAGSDG